jgi:hypothetical protein
MIKTSLYIVMRVDGDYISPTPDVYESRVKAEQAAIKFAKELSPIRYIVALAFPRKITFTSAVTHLAQLDHFSIEETKR